MGAGERPAVRGHLTPIGDFLRGVQIRASPDPQATNPYDRRAWMIRHSDVVAGRTLPPLARGLGVVPLFDTR